MNNHDVNNHDVASMKDVYAVSNRTWVVAFEPRTLSYAIIRKIDSMMTWEVYINGESDDCGEAPGLPSAVLAARARWLGL